MRQTEKTYHDKGARAGAKAQQADISLVLLNHLIKRERGFPDAGGKN